MKALIVVNVIQAGFWIVLFVLGISNAISIVRARRHARNRHCKDCELSHSMFMLRDEIWSHIAKGANRLCLTCAEKRLGRPLLELDFTPVLVNDTVRWAFAKMNAK